MHSSVQNAGLISIWIIGRQTSAIEEQITVLKVLAISGSGRSGSTLLSLLLSQHERVFNLGQLRDLWRAYERSEACSCGKDLQHCDVYGQRVTDAQRMAQACKSFFRDAARRRDWGSAQTRQQLQLEHGEFLRVLQQLLTDIAAATDASYLVDSSKAPEMALAYSLLPGCELYVLNLLRDPRAVACSWYRKKRSLRALLRNARDWKNRQRRLQTWQPQLGERFLPLRYENLALTPSAAVETISDWSGLPLQDSLFEGADLARIDWQHQHLYAPANESVIAERQTEVKIAPAESWQNPRNRWIHGLARFCAGGCGRKHYPA